MLSLTLILDAISTCGSLSNPRNGRVVVQGQSAGSIATYYCNTGYSVQGYSQRVCNINGQWSGTTPACMKAGEKIFLKLYNIMLHGHLHCHIS